MDPDAHLELNAVLRGQSPVDVGHRELHGQPARHRLGRVVGAGDGGAKDDQDRVTDDLVDGALVAADDVHHRLQIEIEDLDDVARGQALGHRGEPAQVGH